MNLSFPVGSVRIGKRGNTCEQTGRLGKTLETRGKKCTTTAGELDDDLIDPPVPIAMIFLEVLC